MKQAVKKAGGAKPASCHMLRHSFVTHFLEDGDDIRRVQALVGHKGVSTVMRDTQVLNRDDRGSNSPADRLGVGPARALTDEVER